MAWSELFLVQQRHTEVVVYAGIVRVKLYGPGVMGHSLLKLRLDVVQKKAEFQVGLYVVRV